MSYRKHLLLILQNFTLRYFQQGSNTLGDKEGLKNNWIQKKTDKELTLKVTKIGDQLHDVVSLLTMLVLRYMIQKNQLCF